MKALVLCVFALAFASFASASVKQKLRDAMNVKTDNDAACMEELNMQDDEWYSEDDIVHHRYADHGNEERTRKNGCAMECTLKKHGIMEGTEINEAHMMTRLDEEITDPEAQPVAHEITSDCMKEIKHITNGCEKGLSLFICVTEAIHALQEIAEHLEEHH